MRILFLDDSHPFDGHSPDRQPLGGAEKALVGLTAALARRDHDVSVINRCTAVTSCDKVNWLPWDTPRPQDVDVLVAWRKPALLDAVETAKTRILWMTGTAKILSKPVHRNRLDKFDPTVVFQGALHKSTFKPRREIKTAIIVPGIRDVFRVGVEGIAAPDEPSDDFKHNARAVVTTHPLHGLDWILKQWSDKIHTRAPNATLHVFSSSLHRGRDGFEVSEELKPVLAQLQAASEQGVKIEKPLADPEMAAFYKAARIHLYPKIASDMYGATLAESQASGLPAVALKGGAADERVRNGQTGFLVPDKDAFVNVTSHLLINAQAALGLARDAQVLQGVRSWDLAAIEFENLLGGS